MRRRTIILGVVFGLWILALRYYQADDFSLIGAVVGTVVIGVIHRWYSIRECRAEIREARRESEARGRVLRVVTDTATNLIALVDREGVFQFVNPAVNRLYQKDLTGMLARDIIHKDDRSSIERLYATRMDGEAATLRVYDAERQLHWITVRLQYIPGGMILIVGQDTTDFTDLSQRYRSLESLVLLSQRQATIGRMAAGIVHDFNSLLTSLDGNAHLAREDPSDRTYSLDNIIEIVRHGKSLTQQLLYYTGAGTHNPRPVQIDELIETIQPLIHTLVRPGITLHYELDCPHVVVHGDPIQLTQILMNLIMNAADAIEGSGKITLRTWQDPTAARIQVIDTGCGIAAESLHRIFDPFFTTKDMGHGVGLAATLTIIQQHQGSVEVTSEIGRGSIFTVHLPATGVTEQHRQVNGTEESTASQTPYHVG